MVYSKNFKSRFPLLYDNGLLTFQKKSVFWLSESAKEIKCVNLESNIQKMKTEGNFLQIYCSQNVYVFDKSDIVIKSNRPFDKVVVNLSLFIGVDETLKLIYYKFLGQSDFEVIPYQRYSINSKFLCILNKGAIKWYSLENLNTLAINLLQDTQPGIPSFLLNICLLNTTHPLLVTYTYDAIFIVDIMNFIQIAKTLDCPIQHHSIIQNHILVFYTNELLAINIVSMCEVELPFKFVKADSCKPLYTDQVIAQCFDNLIVIFDLISLSCTEMQIKQPVKDICYHNGDFFYVDGSDKVFHLKKNEEVWEQDYLRLPDWKLTKLKVVNDKIYLGTLTNWFIYDTN
eukprot:NODE_20_length_44879_cov_0.624654.p14 type:complete len:343 gc:universal NODE_20_length_44879_cov_0.624654:28561-27533(-)